MKLILKQDIDKLGLAGDIVTVKDGYGRNYLIPHGFAVIASPGNIRHAEEMKKQASLKMSKVKQNAEALAARLAGIELEIPAKVGEEGRLFGTITTTTIAEALTHKGVELDRRKLVLSEDIRNVGVYSVTVRLHSEVEGTFKVKVVPEA
ncbi:MAG TPA: 50S ribosomal protein L9 [Rhodothermales bacterium]|nr:50S ribosomal protein L9 [Bacteroidota bacterium]HRK74126.1 50S ribosomal protein L9 [Rhodothermales bacterium]HRR09775.1 50S ribosomal protein L9 [Rhodothermales bacterium]